MYGANSVQDAVTCMASQATDGSHRSGVLFLKVLAQIAASNLVGQSEFDPSSYVLKAMSFSIA